MSLPVIENALLLDGATRSQLEGIIATLQAWILREHKGDGTHGHIHATGLTLPQNSVQEQGRAAPMGVWTDVPYKATNFSGLGFTWTVDPTDRLVQRYMVIGKTLWYALRLFQTTVTGVGTQLRVLLPPGYVVGANMEGINYAIDNSVPLIGAWNAITGQGYIAFYNGAGVPNWTPSVNGTGVFAMVCIEVQ